jgi:MFS family permease
VAVFLSLYGDWLTTVALLVVLYDITHSPAGPAAYVLARVGPRVLGPWFGGALADRLSPRRLMVLACVAQAVLTASLIVFNRSGSVLGILVAVAAAQFVGAMARPSQGALLPTLVQDSSLSRANALYWTFFSSSIFVGPAIGAALLAHVGADGVFAVDAATFAISAVLIATIPRSGTAEVTGKPSTPDRRSQWGGLRLALRDPLIRMVATANFASGVVVTVTQAFLVVAAAERFGGASSVGYLYSGVGIGGTLGGMFALRATPARLWVRHAVFAVIATEVLALAGLSLVAAIGSALALLALSSFAGSLFDVWGATEVQRRSPPGYLGRFNAVIWISQYSGMLIGALWALGTSAFLRWDGALQIASAAMFLFAVVMWTTGGRARSPVKEEP